MTYCDTYPNYFHNNFVTESMYYSYSYSSLPYLCLLLLQNNKDWYLFIIVTYIWYVSVNSE